MRINEGGVKFDPSIDFDHKNTTMEDLIKQSLWWTGNTSTYIVNKKTNELLLKNGRNRMQESVFVGEELFDFNPYDDWESEYSMRDSLINVDTDTNLIKIMNAISNITDDYWKKSLISFFMKNGLHIKYRSSFRLIETLEELTFNGEEIEDEYKIQFCETNKLINSVIVKMIEQYDTGMLSAWDKFYSSVLNYTSYKDEFESFLKNYQDRLLVFPIKDIIQTLMNTPVSSIDENKGDNPILQNSKANLFNEKLIELREVNDINMHVNYKVSCEELGISVSHQRRIIKDALPYLYELFGINIFE